MTTSNFNDLFILRTVELTDQVLKNTQAHFRLMPLSERYLDPSPSWHRAAKGHGSKPFEPSI